MLNTLIITSDEKKILLIHSLNDISEVSLENPTKHLLSLANGLLHIQEVTSDLTDEPTREITINLKLNDIQLSFNSNKQEFKITGTSDIDPSLKNKKLHFTGTSDIDPSFLGTELNLTGTSDIDPSIIDSAHASLTGTSDIDPSLTDGEERSLTGTSDIDPSLTDGEERSLTGTSDIDPSLTDGEERSLTGTSDIDPSLTDGEERSLTGTSDIDPSRSLQDTSMLLNKIFFYKINLNEMKVVFSKEDDTFMIKVYHK